MCDDNNTKGISSIIIMEEVKINICISNVMDEYFDLLTIKRII